MTRCIELRSTLTPLEMDTDQPIQLVLHDGGVREIELLATAARILFTTLPTDSLPLAPARGARTFYEFTCRLRIDDAIHELRREVPTQASFYEPWEIAGLRLWFDAVDDIFTFLREEHGPCRPRRQARFAVQDASARLCPDPVHPWCPLPQPTLNILKCYCGEDVWMGSYFGADAHGGLDINHPPGTPIAAPISIDDHAFFNHTDRGDNNNRWRGRHRWPDGSQWILQCHHVTRLTLPEHQPIQAGRVYAEGAGVLPGEHHHSHFVFKIQDEAGETSLDPWILFWQMYRDRAALGKGKGVGSAL